MIIAHGMIMAGCTPTDSNESDDERTYRHPTLDYTVEVPESWNGKYEVTESTTQEDGIEIASFDYTAAGEPANFIFRIAAYPSSVWNVMMPALNIEPFARNDDYVFASILALDNPYEAPYQEEYGLMSEDIEDIIDSFELEDAVPFGNKDVVVFYGNTQLNPNVDCDVVHPVSRQVPNATDVPFSALQKLFVGPSDIEINEGYTSFFSDKTANAIRTLTVQDGTAYVNLRDIRQIIPNASSSCGSASLLASIESTLFQFDHIDRVIIAIEGSTQTFYDWIQVGCSEENNNCDDGPFRGGQSE